MGRIRGEGFGDRVGLRKIVRNKERVIKSDCVRASVSGGQDDRARRRAREREKEGDTH